MNTFDFAYNAIFKYPPYERFIPWRCDADYEMAVVSPVGIGPRGEKGDPLTWNDMTDQQKDDLILRGVEGGLRGPQGEIGPTGLSAYDLAVQQGYSGTLDEWLESLKGSAFEPDQMSYISHYVAQEVAQRISGFSLTEDFAEATIEVWTDEQDRTTHVIRLAQYFDNPAPSENDIYIISVNGLMLSPMLTGGDLGRSDYVIDTFSDYLCIIFPKKNVTLDERAIHIRRIHGEWDPR